MCVRKLSEKCDISVRSRGNYEASAVGTKQSKPFLVSYPFTTLHIQSMNEAQICHLLLLCIFGLLPSI